MTITALPSPGPLDEPATLLAAFSDLMGLREKFTAFFEQAALAWLEHQIDTNPEFAHVTTRRARVLDFDRETLTYACYPVAWSAHEDDNHEVRIPLEQLLPGYTGSSAA